MPIIKSAKKKMRKDKKKTLKNLVYIKAYKETLKKLKKGGKNTKELISRFYSQVDKAVKSRIIHKNKGSRLKSKIRKLKNSK
ncbi:30S ribosomal protein S20 [Candidatus Roizmanbacteria bacterium CG_4_10_14_0_2_um_filter_36_35]|uniref:Small ribosomal subunit protein bS20 n=4 Tax=Candidatus Roizmaniibacteriota TaxID=1752723 RepID=A0A2M7BXF8_9BACT|nr:MAG: 30S ribosomal protein S20 [Candidatus Roizmanbacteria bacterium CG11_big_fil_rev_8_21_14_0_20_35_14]PIV11257.1 MAG: 30S ribosomal protein S20 [Candidatus Roizmanbacteria bacterium CG03_land_8_20_14_0_80_35_26]PIZ67430.1 MAG: 30S ribosomal protein S20 [Candidatus Roizmanbacteria bacterium CG_4_10_14_0_2_um_filter_36_35]PJC32990.1 MAG: 30S ribosomal protein S20 [Candidatus Roizmanbacteria bacterium CG_4_9_14_0_2_um_filter_36_12]PJC80443.1 MAG: 30S ribosomal protein S20 [Candidatus Roizman